ncbi:sarcoplasmic reticulum histidine-rich calcium-binding protein-like [Drosophila tropicalis]|uniref:sarcoplasmic reticulum histidine-rich calcium-binding protein-like n=1 Tax=Drosophila tropicalis TaxID=46794 RepID=UPI0035AB7520
MDPDIAASSDEENDEDVEDSGYGTEESEAESAMNPGHQEEEEDDEMWRELGEAIAMMENEVADETSSGRSSPDEYAPWEQNEVYEPPARLWEPARPPTPFRMVDSRSEASETAEVAVADEGAADGVASPPPLEPERIDDESELAMMENHQWMSWWRQQILQQQKAERDLLSWERHQQDGSRRCGTTGQHGTRSDEESDDDEPDMMDPDIAASSDEENDEDVEDSGYGTEESEAESAMNPGHQEEEEDDEMWRELGEAIAMMENELSCPVPYGHERYEAVPAEEWPERVVDVVGQMAQHEGPRVVRLVWAGQTSSRRCGTTGQHGTRSDEESDDDEPDMMDPDIAASSDEENDEDVEDSGYGTEESEAESAMNPGQQEEEEDDEMWRELGEAMDG